MRSCVQGRRKNAGSTQPGPASPVASSACRALACQQPHWTRIQGLRRLRLPHLVSSPLLHNHQPLPYPLSGAHLPPSPQPPPCPPAVRTAAVCGVQLPGGGAGEGWPLPHPQGLRDASGAAAGGEWCRQATWPPPGRPGSAPPMHMAAGGGSCPSCPDPPWPGVALAHQPQAQSCAPSAPAPGHTAPRRPGCAWPACGCRACLRRSLSTSSEQTSPRQSFGRVASHHDSSPVHGAPNPQHHGVASSPTWQQSAPAPAAACHPRPPKQL